VERRQIEAERLEGGAFRLDQRPGVWMVDEGRSVPAVDQFGREVRQRPIMAAQRRRDDREMGRLSLP